MRTMLAALAALPLLSEAQPVIVEYEGKVESVDASPYWNFSVGDAIKGIVMLYPLLAPPDRRPARWAGDYVTGGPTDNFVVSDLVTGGNRNDDAVFVNVGSIGTEDRYVLHDIGSIEGGKPEEFRYFSLQVEGRGLVRDDGIAQSFEARPKTDGSSIVSALMLGFGEFRRTVSFAMSRVTMKVPGSCHR
jgi:hypothetical protein